MERSKTWGKIIILGSEKGGVAKTTSTYNLAYCLANLSTCFGIEDTGAVPVTIGHLIMNRIEDEELPDASEYIMSRNGVDFIPSSVMLSVVDAKLRLEMGAERMLAGILDPLKGRYDYILVENFREHGILVPVIVQKMADGYEILSGHNRMNAAKLAGMEEIPAIVKEGLTEREAYVYVIETNLLQRSFSELFVSEKAAVLAERYDKVMSQGKRNDIIWELEEMTGAAVTCGHDDHKLKSRDSLGEEYGLSGSTVARMLRVNQLIPEMKDKLDNGEINLMAAVQMSYVPEKIQRAVVETGRAISKDTATKLRDEDVVEVVKIIEAALEAWFAGKGDADVHRESAGTA